MQIVGQILVLLLDVALGRNVNILKVNPCLICEPFALETYYKLLSMWFKKNPNQENKEQLRVYVLNPLDTLCISLINLCIIAKVKFKEKLTYS